MHAKKFSRTRPKSVSRRVDPPASPAPAMPSAFLDEEQAAAYLRLSVRTMQRLRWTGGGPAFFKFGTKRVLYKAEDLDAWAATRRVGSTSEAPRGAA